jgi:hypothetical protein
MKFRSHACINPSFSVSTITLSNVYYKPLFLQYLLTRKGLQSKVNVNYPCNRPWRPKVCETSRLPHFLDNRLTDGGEVSLTKRQEDSWYSFLLEAELTPGP